MIMEHEILSDVLKKTRAEAAERGFRAGYFKALELAMEEGCFDEDFPEAAYDKVVKMVDERAGDFLIISGMR